MGEGGVEGGGEVGGECAVVCGGEREGERAVVGPGESGGEGTVTVVDDGDGLEHNNQPLKNRWWG